MSDVSISVTEAARNFADCVNRARYQNTSFVLLRNGLPVARLTPNEAQIGEKVCTGMHLAAALKGVSLSEEEGWAWSRDLEAARNALRAPESSWP